MYIIQHPGDALKNEETTRYGSRKQADQKEIIYILEPIEMFNAIVTPSPRSLKCETHNHDNDTVTSRDGALGYSCHSRDYSTLIRQFRQNNRSPTTTPRPVQSVYLRSMTVCNS